MSPCVTCHMSGVMCICFIDVGIWRREGGPLEDLEALAMGSYVRGEESPGAGKKKYCDGKYLEQVGSLESLSSHADWETEEIQYIILDGF